MYSIHVPADYNSINKLLDKFDDSKKQAAFSLKIMKKVIKQYRHDSDSSDDHDPSSHLNCYYIPFEYQEVNLPKHKDRKRRLIEQKVQYEDGAEKTTYCEFNYYCNRNKQVYKEIMNQGKVLGDRNIGFCFVYFNDCNDKLLKKMFVGNFNKLRINKPGTKAICNTTNWQMLKSAPAS